MTAGARELPELRPELALLPSAPHASGAPAWLIHDPVQNRFVQIDEATYHTLSLWPRCRTVDELIAMARAGGRVELDSDTIAGLVEFLHRSKLTLEAPKGGWRYFADERARLERAAVERVHRRLAPPHPAPGVGRRKALEPAEADHAAVLRVEPRERAS